MVLFDLIFLKIVSYRKCKTMNDHLIGLIFKLLTLIILRLQNFHYIC